MVEIRSAYLTACSSFLPGPPIDNDEMVRRLGTDTTRAAAAIRAKVLVANGIRTRHYALDDRGQPTMLNEELAAEAVHRVVKDRGLALTAVGLLATGTTQGDVLVSGFASMVHGRIGGGPKELLSAGGVCAAGMAALAHAVRAVRVGEHDVAVAVGSEVIGRALRQHRYLYPGGRPSFDAEFLRWTLSDGAGAVLVEPSPRPDGMSLRVDWIHLVSHADEYPVCMRAGVADGGTPTAGETWLDYPTVADAEADGLLRLRQNVALLPSLFRAGLADFVELTRSGQLDPGQIDHVLCHYSAAHFRKDIFALLAEAGLMIEEKRWFSNLDTAGNTGAASIFVMLAECWAAGRFRPGERILLIVPESGRFTMGFAQLTCVAGSETTATSTTTTSTTTTSAVGEPATLASSPLGDVPAPDVEAGPDAVLTTTMRDLAGVWADFDKRLRGVPIVARIETGTATLADYRELLLQLRQQVIEGSRWIARTASSFTAAHLDLRSAAIRHAADEHRDYQMLEHDYQAVGGGLATIQSGQKNIGSEALSAYLFHQASQPDPIDMLGAMFVIEGLGFARAAGWAQLLRQQLGLRDDQVSFLRYHGEADEQHMAALHRAVRSAAVDTNASARIVRTAAVTARLYLLQLEEVRGG